jgi:FkbM family methyltransferase
MQTVSEIELLHAYRLILGRDPENGLSLADAAQNWPDWKTMRVDFLRSEEGRAALLSAVFQSFGAMSRPFWVKTSTSFGRPIYVCLTDDAVSKHILLTGSWDERISAAIASRLTPETVFLDAGANVGWFTLFVADYLGKNNGKGKVLSVEANPSILPYLYSSVVESGLAAFVEIKPYAIGNTQSMMQMDTSTTGNVGGLGVLPFASAPSNRHIVPSVRLDDLFCDLQRLDLIKMDIEGAEYLAIEGAEALLKRLRPSIIIEFNTPALSSVSGKAPADVVNYLINLGFEPYNFVDQPYGCEQRLSVDALEHLLAQRGHCSDFVFTSTD